MRDLYKFLIRNIKDISEDFDFEGELLKKYRILPLLLIIFIYLLVGIVGLVLLVPTIIAVLWHDLYIGWVAMNKEKYDRIYVKQVIQDYEKKLLENGTYNLGKEFGIQCSLYDFIYKFIRQHTSQLDTYDKNGLLICDRYHVRRSLGDTFLVCKHYFPECTLEQVIKHLIYYLQIRYIGGYRCNDIKKFVYHMNTSYHNLNDNLEYGEGLKWQDIVDTYKK